MKEKTKEIKDKDLENVSGGIPLIIGNNKSNKPTLGAPICDDFDKSNFTPNTSRPNVGLPNLGMPNLGFPNLDSPAQNDYDKTGKNKLNKTVKDIIDSKKGIM